MYTFFTTIETEGVRIPAWMEHLGRPETSCYSHLEHELQQQQHQAITFQASGPLHHPQACATPRIRPSHTLSVSGSALSPYCFHELLIFFASMSSGFFLLFASMTTCMLCVTYLLEILLSISLSSGSFSLVRFHELLPLHVCVLLPWAPPLSLFCSSSKSNSFILLFLPWPLVCHF